MAYPGVIVRLLLSAPGDLSANDRDRIAQIVADWNVREGESRGCAFVLMNWSDHAAAHWGIRPQGSINEQLVDLADVVLAVFWTRLGSPTGEAESGTVEELERAAGDGKYVAVLRCNRPVEVAEIDHEQLGRLEGYFAENRSAGLVKSYNDDVSLTSEVESVLLYAAGRSAATVAAPAQVEQQANLTADVAWTDRSKGKFDLVVANEGDRPAYDVTIAVAPAEGQTGEVPMLMIPDGGIPMMNAKQRMPFAGIAFGGVADLVEVTFEFADEARSADRRRTKSVVHV